MAFESGVAAGHIDYWNKLIAFLTTDPDLIAADAEWSIVWTHPSGTQSGIVLRGKGSSGSENIYIGLSLTTGVNPDDHRINIFGMSGVLAFATSMGQHINVSPEMRVWLDAFGMKYWFVANARRFAFVANMSTVYQVGYAGYILPFATPLNYPYPVFVGGTSNAFASSGTVTNWRSLSDYHAHFLFSPYVSSAGASELIRTNAYLLDPFAQWRACSITNSSGITLGPRMYRNDDADGSSRWGLSSSGSAGFRFGSEPIRVREVENYGGGMSLSPVSLFQEVPSNQNFGVLDGVYLCPGQSNAAENLIQIDSVDHLVIQNVWRTDVAEYWALALE